MIHVYQGDGKGKTTAAFGMALRAVAAGWQVVVVQFLKDGTSGEARMLAGYPNVTLLSAGPAAKFTCVMGEQDRAAARAAHDANLAQAARLAEEGVCDLLVLDEVAAALREGLLDEGPLRPLLARAAGNPAFELVATGRKPPRPLLEQADYVTDMRCGRHPAARGVRAREGVEL